jgi:hypothetical protein
MRLSVSIVAPTRRLTRSDLVGAELGVQFTNDQKKQVDRLIDGATSAIEGMCNVQSFAREAVSEALKGYDELELELSRRPVVLVSQVSLDSNVITDFNIHDADDGTLYRQAGWDWTAQHRFSLNGRQRWPASGQPTAGREEPSISVDYVGGYILPEQWLLDVANVSVAALDQSFNSPGAFPALLKPGDLVIASGFSNAANNGRFVVSSATTSKIIVSGAALVLEGAAAARSLTFAPPAHCRAFDGLQRGALIAVKAAWLTIQDDPDVIERQVGQLRTRRTEGFHEDPTLAIPGEALGFIRPWLRSI